MKKTVFEKVDGGQKQETNAKGLRITEKKERMKDKLSGWTEGQMNKKK